MGPVSALRRHARKISSIGRARASQRWQRKRENPTTYATSTSGSSIHIHSLQDSSRQEQTSLHALPWQAYVNRSMVHGKIVVNTLGSPYSRIRCLDKTGFEADFLYLGLRCSNKIVEGLFGIGWKVVWTAKGARHLAKVVKDPEGFGLEGGRSYRIL